MAAPASQPIRRQLILLVLTLGVPFLVFLVVSAVLHARHERHMAGDRMLALAHVTSARLDDHIGDIAQVLAVLSEVVGVTPADEAANDALLTRLAPRLPPHVNNVTVFALDGRNVGSIDPRMRSAQVDLAPRSYFQQALAQPGLVSQAPFRSTLNGESVGIFALRISRGGRVVGVVSLGTRLRELQGLLMPAASQPDGSVTTVVGQDGVVLARSIDPEKWIGRNISGSLSGFADSLRLGDGVNDGPSADGVRRIGGFTTARRVPWLVYVGVPEDEAIAETHAQLWENLTAGAVMLLVGVLLSLVIARRISSPLLHLQADARALEGGDLSRRSQVRGSGEIAVLSRTLDQMAATLQQRTALLEASEEQLADLYAKAPCGYHSLDAEGRFVRINDTELRWLGYAREEVVGQMHMTDFLTPEGRQDFREQFPRLLTEDTLDDIEFDLVGRSGERRHVIASVSVLRDATGAFESTRTALYDISELQRARRSLRDLTSEQQAILDTDLVAILRLKDRHIVWCNRGAERLFDYGPGDLVGHPTRIYYPDDASYERLGAKGRDMLSGGKPFSDQLQLVSATGKILWIDMSCAVLPAKPDEILCLMVDVTQRRNAEEGRLRGLALELENRQLREAGEFKSLFLSNMSHELRTPLNAVVGYTHLLQAGVVKPGSADHDSHLERIGQGAQQLQEMIGAMLDFAKSGSEALEFHPQAVDLSRVVRFVLDSLDNAIREKDIDIATEVDAGLGDPFVDELRLTQVLSEFVSNAVKFSRPGGLVEIRVAADGPAEFRIEVEDHGAGIAEADVPRLFTVFQSLSRGGPRAHSGTGVGLALARKLVQAQGGRVGAVSRLAFGSTFHLVLPMVAA